MLLAQYIIEAVTIATVAIVCIILAVYLLVLKKNGWLGSRGSRFYRCPNQECKRIFQKPIELKDLSETPARVYSACPHCGIDLGSLLVSDIEKKLGVKIKTSPQEKTGIKIEDSASRIENRKPEIVEQIESSSMKSLKPIEIEKTQTVTENRKRLWMTFETAKPTTAREEPDALRNTPQKSHSPQKAPKEGASNTKLEAANEGPEGCVYFFGYLGRLPKDSVIPPTCYSCRRMIECYIR